MGKFKITNLCLRSNYHINYTKDQYLSVFYKYWKETVIGIWNLIKVTSKVDQFVVTYPIGLVVIGSDERAGIEIGRDVPV